MLGCYLFRYHLAMIVVVPTKQQFTVFGLIGCWSH